MSCRFDSTFSTDTFDDICLDSKKKSSRIDEPSQVFNQSLEIEKYLQNNDNKSRDNEAYRLVESLFALFNTEVKMNQELRKVIFKERKKLRTLQIDDTQLMGFYKEISRLTGVDVCSYDDVCEIFVTLKQKYISKQNKQAKTIAKQNEAIQQLKSENEELKRKFQNAIRQIQNDDTEFDNFAEKLKNVTANNDKLTIDLRESNNIIKQQQSVINDLKEQLGHYKKSIDESKFESKDLFEKMSQMQRKVDQYSITEMQKEGEKKALVDKLNESSQLLKSEKDRVSDLLTKYTEISQEKAQLESSLKETEQTLNRAVNKIGKLRKKNERLVQKLQETVESVRQDYIIEMDRNLNEQKENFEKQIQDYNQANSIVEEQNVTLKQKLEKKTEEIKIVHDGINEYKDRLTKMKVALNQYKEENERLRNIMRQQTLQYSKYEEFTQAFESISNILNMKGSTPKQVVSSIKTLIDEE